MSITSKIAGAPSALTLAMILGGCLPGPWEYKPSGAPVFRGITVSAYAVADRPVTDVCFERQLSLDEASTDAKAFYDSALVTITGLFSNGAQTLQLQARDVPPNCFTGPAGTRFVRGNSYTLSARFVWDSAGTPAVSLLNSTARIPLDFAVKDTAASVALVQTGVALPGITDPAVFNALPAKTRLLFLNKYGDTLTAMHGNPAALAAWLSVHGPAFYQEVMLWLATDAASFKRGDSVYYLAAKFNFAEMSHYYSSRRSPDVKGVLITRRYDTTESRPESSFDSIGGFVPTLPQFYQAGNMNRLISYSDFVNSGGRSIFDSMGVVNVWFWTGKNRLYFYGAEAIYADYQDAILEAQENSKIRLPSNVTGGKGFFAGMIVDSFDIYLKLDGQTQAFPYRQTRVAACQEKGWYDNRDCLGYYREFCRDTLWSVKTCKRDAGYTFLDPLESLALPDSVHDSAASWMANDTAFSREVTARYCIDNNYPSGVPACAPMKTLCETGSPGNRCQQILWTRCEIAYWKMPACTEGIKSYCREKRKVAKTLCRDVP
jgi:hypothetical protein